MALACASVDDVLVEASEVLTDDDASYCALAGDASTAGVLARWTDPVRVGTDLLSSLDVYRTLLSTLTRIDAPFPFEGPAPMLSARLLARRLSLIAANSNAIERVDLPIDQVRRQAVLARLGVLPSMVYVSTDGPSLQLRAKPAARVPGFAADAAKSASFAKLVEKLAAANACLLPSAASPNEYDLVDKLLWFVGDEAELRGSDILSTSLAGADALPASCRALLMLHAVCRHLAWTNCAELLRLAASAAGEAAEQMRGEGVVAESLRLPEGEAAVAPLSSEDAERIEQLEARVAQLLKEMAEDERESVPERERESVPELEEAAVAIPERTRQREAVIDALRLFLFMPKGSSWRFPINRDDMEAQLEAFGDDAYSTQLALDIRRILLRIDAYEVKVGQPWTSVSINEARQQLQDAVLLMLAPGTDADYALLLQIANLSGGGEMLIDAGEEFKRQFYEDGDKKAWPELYDLVMAFENVFFTESLYFRASDPEQFPANASVGQDGWKGGGDAVTSFSAIDAYNGKWQSLAILLVPEGADYSTIEARKKGSENARARMLEQAEAKEAARKAAEETARDSEIIAAREEEDEVIYHGMRWLWQDPDKTMAQLSVGDYTIADQKGHLLGYSGDLKRRFEQALKTMKRLETYEKVLTSQSPEMINGKPREKDGKPVLIETQTIETTESMDVLVQDEAFFVRTAKERAEYLSERLKRAMTVAARDELLQEGATVNKERIEALAAQKLKAALAQSALGQPWDPITTVESDEWRSFCRDEFHLDNWRVRRMEQELTDTSRLFGEKVAFMQPGGDLPWFARAMRHRVKFLMKRNLDVFYDEKQRDALWGTPQNPNGALQKAYKQVAIMPKRSVESDPPWTARSWRQALTAYVDIKWKRPNRDPASERCYTHIDGLEEVANEASAKVRVNTLRATLVKANESLEKATQDGAVMKTAELEGTIAALTRELETRGVELQNAIKVRAKTRALRKLTVPLNDKGTLTTQRDAWPAEEVQARAGLLLGLLTPVMLEAAPGEAACAPTGAQVQTIVPTLPMAMSMAWPLVASMPTAAGPPPPPMAPPPMAPPPMAPPPMTPPPMMGIPPLPPPPIAPPPPPPFPGGLSVPVDPTWDPMWRIPMITIYDAGDPLPDWFAKAFQEREGVGTIAKAKSVPKAAGGGANAQADMFAEIRAMKAAAEARSKKVREDPREAREREQKAAEEAAAKGGAGKELVRRASDVRKGSLFRRRDLNASEGTSLSVSEFHLGMSTTGASAGSSSGAGAHAALALKLFVLFQYASPETNNRYVQEARRRLQPTRPTLIDALEVEVRTRFHALVVL